MTEKDEFENDRVLLWGLIKASSKLLDKYDKGNKNPNSKKRKQIVVEEEINEDVVEAQPRTYDVDEMYNINDLDFLNTEYDRIEDKLSKTTDMDEMEELEDIQDKLYNLIEGLETMKTMTGKGFKKGSPEAKAHAEKMRMIRLTKNNNRPTKPTKIVNTSKARVIKGSEEAKALGQRLSEARKAKAINKPTKPIKQPKITGKPWYYIGDIPKGYREATEEEAIKADKVSKYGKYAIDEERYTLYKMYNIILDDKLDNNVLSGTINGLKRRLIKLLEEIEKVRLKTQSEKYRNDLDNNYQKLMELKNEKRYVSAAYNWYYKLLMERLGKPFVRQKIKLEERVIPIQKTEVIYNEPIKVNDRPKQTKYYFTTKTRTFDIPIKAFDKDMKLKTKHINKLLQNNILLLPKYYKDEDADEIFGKIVGGSILSMKGLEDAFKGFEFGVERVGSYAKALLVGRGDDYAPYIRTLLKKYGEEQLTEIMIIREPVQSAIRAILNILSLGKIGKRMERKNYDELFHLKILITTVNGNKFTIEKNEKINIEKVNKIPTGEQQIVKKLPNSITMNSLLQGGKNIQGDKFHYYSGYDNNCQDFILALLKGSNLGDASDYAFIKQDTKSLFEKYGYIPTIMNATTDLAGRFNELIYGAGIVNRKPDKSIKKIVQSVYFDKKDRWNLSSSKEWLKKNGFYNKQYDDNKEYIRFRQYNPEDLHIDRYYITEIVGSEKKPVYLITSIMNKGLVEGGAIYDYLNPIKYALANKSTSKLMNKTGQITRDNLIPLAVDLGKPLLYGYSGLVSSALTGNPMYGLYGAKQLWEKYGNQYAPKQKSDRLSNFTNSINDKIYKIDEYDEEYDEE